jgi:hypothetical protein
LSTTRGYSVPHHRLSLCVGPHSSPGFSGVSLSRLQTRSALILAILAVADNPRRLLPHNDDSTMGSCACPCTALLDGIRSRILRDRLLSPLCGLRISRYRRGYALTSTPEGQELHLHGGEVIKDRMILTLYPLSSCGEGSFRETDRTCNEWLDTVSVSTCPCAVQSASVHPGKTDTRCSRDPSPARRDPRGPVSGLLSTLPQTSNRIIAPASVRAAPRSLEGGEAYAPRISSNGAPDPAGWPTFRCSPWTTFLCSLTTATRTRTDPERLPAFQPLTPGTGPAAAAQPR